MVSKLNCDTFFSLFGFQSILIFKASRTSAEPQLDETALLPCLATFTPLLAKTIAEA